MALCPAAYNLRERPSSLLLLATAHLPLFAIDSADAAADNWSNVAFFKWSGKRWTAGSWGVRRTEANNSRPLYRLTERRSKRSLRIRRELMLCDVLISFLFCPSDSFIMAMHDRAQTTHQMFCLSNCDGLCSQLSSTGDTRQFGSASSSQ